MTTKTETDHEVLVLAAETALLAARLERIAFELSPVAANSVRGQVTELRRVDTSLRALIRLTRGETTAT
jgi:hypothetical protein